jgi:hypothetical protein
VTDFVLPIPLIDTAVKLRLEVGRSAIPEIPAFSPKPLTAPTNARPTTTIFEAAMKHVISSLGFVPVK